MMILRAENAQFVGVNHSIERTKTALYTRFAGTVITPDLDVMTA
ncbi:MAG: hypothetical protein ACI4RJ_01765 [Alphaproteobacteria bacterium]